VSGSLARAMIADASQSGTGVRYSGRPEGSSHRPFGPVACSSGGALSTALCIPTSISFIRMSPAGLHGVWGTPAVVAPVVQRY
jgi:hypothetical protein